MEQNGILGRHRTATYILIAVSDLKKIKNKNLMRKHEGGSSCKANSGCNTTLTLKFEQYEYQHIGFCEIFLVMYVNHCSSLAG